MVIVESFECGIIIFQWHGIQPPNRAVISTIHMVLFINCSPIILLLEIHHDHGHFLLIHFLPGTFHFLTEPGFFFMCYEVSHFC